MYPPPAEVVGHRLRMNTFLGKWLHTSPSSGHGVATLRRAPAHATTAHEIARLRLTLPGRASKLVRFPARGAIAQLGERLHGMQEVGGSIPPGSTNFVHRQASSTYGWIKFQCPHRLEA